MPPVTACCGSRLVAAADWKGGAAARLLGMLPKDDKATIKLAGVADDSLRDFPALAITVEPAQGSGGSPTGPVVASGDCFKFW